MSSSSLSVNLEKWMTSLSNVHKCVYFRHWDSLCFTTFHKDSESYSLTGEWHKDGSWSVKICYPWPDHFYREGFGGTFSCKTRLYKSAEVLTSKV